MDNQSKEEDSDSREFYGLQVSELLEALAEGRSPPCDCTRIDPRNISTSLSILKNTGTTDIHRSFRSRAILPEDIVGLSKCQFKRRDHLNESFPAPIATVASSQPILPSSNPVVLAHLVGKSKMGEWAQKHELHPHILGVQTWTKQLSCEPWFPQTGPTNEWFFEDLTDLQRKLFFGAPSKPGVLRDSWKTVRHNQSDSTSLPPS